MRLRYRWHRCLLAVVTNILFWQKGFALASRTWKILKIDFLVHFLRVRILLSSADYQLIPVNIFSSGKRLFRDTLFPSRPIPSIHRRIFNLRLIDCWTTTSAIPRHDWEGGVIRKERVGASFGRTTLSVGRSLLCVALICSPDNLLSWTSMAAGQVMCPVLSAAMPSLFQRRRTRRCYIGMRWRWSFIVCQSLQWPVRWLP